MATGSSKATEALAPMTLEQFRDLHPWPDEYRAAKKVEVFFHFDLPARLEDVWPLLADSSRMNRALGQGEMKFVQREGVRLGSSVRGGVDHAWVEVPWDWVFGQWLSSTRIYEKGFMTVSYTAFRLQALEPGKTRLYSYFGAVPRNVLFGLALRYGLPGIRTAYERVLPELIPAATPLKPLLRPALLLARPKRISVEGAERLEKIREALLAKQLDRSCVDALVEWIRTGDDLDLNRIQVRERARTWNLDEDALLKVCLHATRAGLLQLSWDTVCPHCRGPAAETPNLGGLSATGACAVCEIDFGTDQYEAIEITFKVHPSIRAVPEQAYCSAEPSHKEHILVQRKVAPGASTEVSMPGLSAGRYRLRLHGEKRYGYLEVGQGEPRTREWRATQDVGSVGIAAAPSLRLLNDSPAQQTFIVEAAKWNDFALRPGRLLSFQEFRDLFSEEYLGADVQLAIGQQTILFTDIVGSTAMYAQRGDPAAFAEVRRHFTELFAIIGKNRGAVVKTIGDAAMAAFNDPLDAVKASQEIHQAFHPERAEMPRLRISLNNGPCIAVKLNTAIDYFGHTVNVAAKLQGLAEAWQVAMAQSVFEATGVAAWLKEQGVAVEPLSYTSKALLEPIRVQRWSVFTRPPSRSR